MDYAFKRVFGRQENGESLCSLLNAVLNRPPGQRVESVVILNPFLPLETLDDKLSVLDIKARDESGRNFNVEMQIRGMVQNELASGIRCPLLSPLLRLCGGEG